MPFRLIRAKIEFWFYHIHSTVQTLYLKIFYWILPSRKHRTNGDLIVAKPPKSRFPVPFGIWYYRVIYDVIASMQTWKHGTQKPYILTFTLIPSSFFRRSLCKIILMNVHYFPNAPRTLSFCLNLVKNRFKNMFLCFLKKYLTRSSTLI